MRWQGEKLVPGRSPRFGFLRLPAASLRLTSKFGLVALAREGKWTKGTLCNMLLSCNDCVLNSKLKDNIFQLKKKKKGKKSYSEK